MIFSLDDIDVKRGTATFPRRHRVFRPATLIRYGARHYSARQGRIEYSSEGGGRLLSQLPPLMTQIGSRLFPGGKLKYEPRFRQARRHDPSTFQYQLGFRPHEESPDFEQPPPGRQAKTASPGGTKGAHELCIRNRVWRREVDRPGQVFMVNNPGNRTDEVAFVDPRDILAAVPARPTEAPTDQSQ